MGLNFFGTTFCEEGSVHILGRDYIDLLESFRPVVKWNSEYSEHYINYEHEGLQWTAYYPSLKVLFIID